MHIDTDFEGGSIHVLDASNPGAVGLALRPDNASHFKQWFFFRVRGARGTPCSFHIMDAASSSYPRGWENYRAVASYDGEHWFRVPTEYQGGTLSIRHAPERDVIAYAAFPPYLSERYDGLVAAVRASRNASLIELGKSVEGRPIHMFIAGNPHRHTRRIWIIAHQHPGETMAGWFMEGVTARLLDEGDPVTRALLDKAALYLVPRMNPDGCARGNHRTNAAGRDLNREWVDPSREASPEVFAVRESIAYSGIDLFLDVHGDESIPYVFAFGAEGVPRYSGRLAWLEESFTGALAAIDGDFQREHGYELDPPGTADLRLANMYMAERFDCLSFGLEMPFKDNANRPDFEVGWSPARCRRFGRSVLEASLACVDKLR